MSGDSLKTLKQTASLVSAIIWLYDVKKQQIVFANDQLEKQLGYASDSFDKIELKQLFAATDQPVIAKKIDTVIHSAVDEPVSVDCHILHLSGHPIPFSLKCSNFQTDSQNTDPQYLLFTAEKTNNIDENAVKKELLRTNKLIQESERKLHFGTYEWNVEKEIIKWSAGVFDIFDYNNDNHDFKLTPRFYLDHVAADDKDRLKDAVHKVMEENDETDISYKIITAKGETRYVNSTMRVIFDKNGEASKIIGTTRDITDIKRAEEAIAEHVNELHRSNQDLEEFAYVASHDLQEPLRKISTFSGRIISKYADQLDDEGRMYLDRILAATGNMRTLIDYLLEFSRAIQPNHHFAPTDLNNIIQQVSRDLELVIEETGTTIQYDNLPEIPAVGSQIKQVFYNIINNAIKFRKEGIPPVISIEATKPTEEELRKYKLSNKPYVKIVITDNGIGFEEEYAERIFKIFQRLHGKAEYPGSGIGLAICKKIVDHHEGAIFAKNIPDQGACFNIILPQ